AGGGCLLVVALSLRTTEARHLAPPLLWRPVAWLLWLLSLLWLRPVPQPQPPGAMRSSNLCSVRLIGFMVFTSFLSSSRRPEDSRGCETPIQTPLRWLARVSQVSSKVGRQPSPGYPASLPSLPLSGLIGIKIFVVGRDGLRLGPDRAFVIE